MGRRAWGPGQLSSREVADKAVEGYVLFHHIGDTWFRVGRTNIDWSGPQIRHQEWPAQLNRFFQLPTLLDAWEKTGDERYAMTSRDLIADWIRVHPTRGGWTLAKYDNTLNLSIRNQQWLGTLPYFLNSPAFNDAFVTSVVESSACQIEFLCGRLNRDGNWRIAQADSILNAGVLLTGHPKAERWRRLGVSVINDAFERQVLPDGVHVERTPDYHNWMRAVFEGYWRASRAMPELGLQIRPEVVARMYDYELASLRPNGAMNALHDCDGAHTGKRRADWSAARGSFLRMAGLLDDLPPTSQNFPYAGQACWRDSWEESATYVTFDASNWGGGHCHLSRNTVQMHAFGRSLIVDPGTLTYEVSDPMLACGRSTRAHSTMNLNGWNQSESDPTSRFVSVEGYDLAEGLYAGGYWPGRYQWGWTEGHGRGLWAQHHRTALWVRGRCLVILDCLRCDAASAGGPFAESNWQFSEGRVALDAERRRAVTQHPDANLLMLLPLLPAGAQWALHEGEKEPPRGWLRGENGYAPGPMLSLTVNAIAPETHWAAVLIPFQGADAPQVSAQADADRAGTLTLQWGDGHTDTVLWSPRIECAIGAADRIETDASLLHLHRGAQGRLVRGSPSTGTMSSPSSPRGGPRAGASRFDASGLSRTRLTEATSVVRLSMASEA